MIKHITVSELIAMPGFAECVEEYHDEADRIAALGDPRPIFAAYRNLEEAGLLRLLCAVDGAGRLDGFAVGIVSPDLHHGVKTLFLDCLFVRRAARKGGAGLRLFGSMRGLARECGVGLICAAPVGSKAERLFTAMGLEKEQTIFFAN